MSDAASPVPDVDPEREAATKAQVLIAAERLFALHGFQNVSVRDITAEAGRQPRVSVNYHFGSKDALLFEIFRRRTAELNRERARMLHEAADRHGGKPPVREILRALFEPPLRWSSPDNDRRISVQFIIRARSEGTEAMREVLRTDVSHLRRFADALMAARPELAPEEVYWRLHFVPRHDPQQPLRRVRPPAHPLRGPDPRERHRGAAAPHAGFRRGGIPGIAGGQSGHAGGSSVFMTVAP